MARRGRAIHGGVSSDWLLSHVDYRHFVMVEPHFT